MKRNILAVVSFLGLLLTVVPSLLFFNSIVSFEFYKIAMLAGTLIWFASAPLWIGFKNKS